MSDTPIDLNNDPEWLDVLGFNAELKESIKYIPMNAIFQVPSPKRETLILNLDNQIDFLLWLASIQYAYLHKISNEDEIDYIKDFNEFCNRMSFKKSNYLERME